MNAIVSRRPTVLVMHADPLLRAGLAAALRDQGGFEILVHGLDNPAAGPPQIEIVITDYEGAMRLAGAPTQAPGTLGSARIVVLTTNEREADIRRAIEAGVHGYILQGCAMDELIEGLATVAGGMRYVSRAAAQRMADSLTRTSLTARELDVLELVVAGDSNKSIARQLRIEVGTVKTHMMAIMSKLGAASRTQAAAIATARGLVSEVRLHPPLPGSMAHLQATRESTLRWSR